MKPHPHWNKKRVTSPTPRIQVTFFPNEYAKSKTSKSMTLNELRDLIQSTSKPNRATLPWLKLATFGDQRSANNCFRTDANLMKINGVEGDYDAEQLTLDAAIAIAQKAKLLALFYTTASYTDAAPCWRILAPTSRLLAPDERAKLMARVNGLYGGVFARESFVLSQSYYFGSVNNNMLHRAVIVEGDYIDLKDDLDAAAIGPNKSNDDASEHASNMELEAANHDEAAAALAAIPNDSKFDNWHDWNNVALAMWAATNGSEVGWLAFQEWCRTWAGCNGVSYNALKTRARWLAITRSPPSRIGTGTLFHLADEANPNWRSEFNAENNRHGAQMAEAIGFGKNKQKEQNESSADTPFKHGRQKYGHSWDDPDTSILFDQRGDLPEFPLDVFQPGGCRDWVDRAANGAGVTPAHVAVPLIGIASGLIGTARRVRASTSFSQPCAMWCAIVGYSGSGKTPGIDTIKLALKEVERSKKSDIANQQHVHEAKVEAAKAARALWKKNVEDAAAGPVVNLNKVRAIKNTPPLPLEAVIPPPFVVPRLFVTNATIERVAVLLTARPRGMLMLVDELAGLFLNMSRYTNGSDREFWLEAWNGGSYVVERMSRPSVSVDHLLVGLVGGLQPDKLAKSFSGDQDGLYARMLFAWPVEAPYRPLTDDVEEIDPEIVYALTRLVDLADGGADAFNPAPVALTFEAVALFEELRKLAHFERQVLDGRERDWASKMQAHVLRLAITLEYLDWAFRSGEEPRQISAQSLAAAVQLVYEYFWPHARAALRQIGLSDHHKNARRVMRWAKGRGADFISVKDARREALSQSIDADQTLELINKLVAAGWLREVTPPSGPQGGKPARRWEVNPLLHAVTAQRAQTDL